MINVEFFDFDNLDVDFPDEQNIEIDEKIEFSPETDHRKLTHRDAENQHPISAIDNLEETLENLQDESISNTELQEFFRSR